MTRTMIALELAGLAISAKQTGNDEDLRKKIHEARALLASDAGLASLDDADFLRTLVKETRAIV